MAKNIFIELELSLEPLITEERAMREYLERDRIPFWQNNQNSVPRYEVFVDKARKYIEAGFPLLEQQANQARDEKYGELTREAKKIIGFGVTEPQVKALVNDFKNFFHPDTIKKLVPLKSSSTNQSENEFVIPVCPDSLKCDKPVSYSDMDKISFDLNVATDGKDDSLYKLLKVNEREKTEDILTKATAMSKEINNITKKDIKANALNRLSAKFLLFFKTDNARKNYDVARKRFRFDEYADKTLKRNVNAWLEKKKTTWKEYHACIDEVKRLGYTPDEAAWLVYEYFCHPSLPEKRRCFPPVPEEKPKPGGAFDFDVKKTSGGEKTPINKVLDDAVKNIFG